ncbi:MAG: glycosyltransferase family 4 protein [Candidatus Omnitrophica bacterium]|nr:glycosyltransferase family 4 protein [Candidatus Omnitrophota bacterium]
MLKEKPRHVRGTKIVVLGTRGFPDVQGGIETHCENLYPHLVKKGYQVVALGRMSYVGDDAFYHEGITVLPVRCPKHKFLETIIHSLKGVFIARKIKCDVLHIHAVGPALVTPLARLLGMKAVFTHHGADYRRAKWGRVARLMLRLGECLGVCFANEVIAISQAIADYLADTYKRRVTVIPNGVAPAHAAGTNSILTKHGLERGKYVLAVGRFVPEKGFDDLMDSFTEMINNNGFGDWKLVIAGDADHEDNYSARLKEKAAGDAHIVLTGFISGAPLTELYSHAGLFVQPSSHEGLPIALLEAMSYGLPCIASDIPAHAGTGLLEKSRLFKKGDAGALTALLEHALHNPLTEDEKIHQINTVAERFRWDRIADETARIYQRLTLS